jgi:hypothetical protein
MRCTEGVWLSVTPTRAALFVAMDFEGAWSFGIGMWSIIESNAGVHSIERSAQEGEIISAVTLQSQFNAFQIRFSSYWIPPSQTSWVILFCESLANHNRIRCYSEITLHCLEISPNCLRQVMLCTGSSFSEFLQSFQSCTTILDPTTNPSLFQSNLVIIVKVL